MIADEETRGAGQPLELRPEPECEYPYTDETGELRFRYGSPGLRYYLCGEPVHAGDVLEMRLDDGAWTCIRFEWNPAAKQALPVLCFDDQSAMNLPEEARFRWLKRIEKE
jgi:hypothetical protein